MHDIVANLSSVLIFSLGSQLKTFVKERMGTNLWVRDLNSWLSDQEYAELKALLEQAQKVGLAFALWSTILLVVLSEYLSIMRVLILTLQTLVHIVFW